MYVTSIQAGKVQFSDGSRCDLPAWCRCERSVLPILARDGLPEVILTLKVPGEAGYRGETLRERYARGSDYARAIAWLDSVRRK